MEEEKSKAIAIKQDQKSEVPASKVQLKNLNINSPEAMVEVAKEVAKYVNTNALSVQIQKKPYVMVEGWQFTAGLLGLVGMVEEVQNDSSYDEITFKWETTWDGKTTKKEFKTKLYKYRAKAVFKNPTTGAIVGQGFAMCSNEELKKHVFDEFAIMSMAQTRAIGKAARMAFSFIIKAAGYEPTPAEEMDGINDDAGTTVDTVLPTNIVDKVAGFKDSKELLSWAGSEELSRYHKNATFRRLVDLKNKELDGNA